MIKQKSFGNWVRLIKLSFYIRKAIFIPIHSNSTDTKKRSYLRTNRRRNSMLKDMRYDDDLL